MSIYNKKSLNPFFLLLLQALLIYGSFCTNIFALDANTELAKKSQNPVENMVTIPFNSNFNYGYGPDETTQYILDIKPVIPFRLSSTWNLITRTIIPINNQQNLSSKGYLTEVGDINSTFFLSPANPGRILWGIGPYFILPTGSNPQIGQGKYSLGPSVVALIMPNNWVIGALLNNAWSVAGEGKRATVNQFSMQYFINYNFPHGWYITSSPTINIDWTQPANNRYTIPFGAGIGRVFQIGKQSINASLQAYDNVVTPKILGPSWQLDVDITFLFPET